MGKNTTRKKFGKKAIVFGSSGLVGSQLVSQLCELPGYAEIVCVNRKSQKKDHPKYREIISDLSDLSKISDRIKGDEIYCCLGTTIKKAGSQEQFRKVDFDLPIEIANIAVKNKSSHMFMVSSLGADKNSGNFYLRTKGEMETAFLELEIPTQTIARPSMLLGERKESRFGENVGKVLMKIFSFGMIGKIKKYRGIQAADVAKAMVIIANSEPTSRHIFESDILQEIADAEM